ncbi:tRNA-dihydrouridine synthase [Haloplanus aerogenes]|uniref:Dihydropyrimidine dehydrogenase n=1 Tax=Haloplanus aerogenes TaxID=660522 RepID=A0A3M0E239_9EURY|nr:tRNA-dihydrouridine synthase [Haloplanus aerogenes]AZH25820.1 dihydropyrimidine dehydrogenase [Haloplanus aerogenes]RMB25563.1 TIM-barrel protein [Haloplanus aerogenes]
MLALASLSGASDADWARAGAAHADLALLGGIALDADARAAARDLVARGRDEFLPTDPLAFVDAQLAALDDAPISAGMNVRSATRDPIREAAAVCADHGAVLEINAHCRQDELCAVGCGETLLRDTDRLVDYVAAAHDAGATVSVKVRAEVEGVDLPATARAIADAGADAIHVDAMDSEPVVADVVAAAPDLFCLANNGVRDRATAWEYLAYGADGVSVGRPSDDPDVLRRVARAVADWERRRGDGERVDIDGEVPG